MDRSMSYELDGAFAGRNAGELVSVQKSRTVVRRTPGLTASGADLSLGRRIPGPKTVRQMPMMDRRIPTMHNRALSTERNTRLVEARGTRAATGLADAYSPMDGMGLEIPGLGLVSWSQIAVGAAVGMALMALLRRR